MSRSSAEPSQIAIDASALLELLLQTTLGGQIAGQVGGSQLIAPDIVNPEVIQGLRGLERGGKLSSARASRAVQRLAHSPVRRVPTTGLIADAWALRANLSAYDACYVALARALDCPLLSTDAPLKRAPLPGVRFLNIG
ncbi:MAG TPA: type II toxin-antitoxin system VapC family toxin [Solirubrobacteraceae bacterium]|jgi:predicted nucleic acid-binding protein|nr:type II toxin-antitoxin system VapC family toxin [Solirubrobacteraceae bacterium]